MEEKRYVIPHKSVKGKIEICYEQLSKLHERSKSLQARKIVDCIDSIVKTMDDIFVYFNERL